MFAQLSCLIPIDTDITRAVLRVDNRHFQTANFGLSQGFVTSTYIAVAGSANGTAVSSALLKDGSRKQIRPAVFHRHYRDCRLARVWIKARAKPKTSLIPKPPSHLLFSVCPGVAQKQGISRAGTCSLSSFPGAAGAVTSQVWVKYLGSPVTSHTRAPDTGDWRGHPCRGSGLHQSGSLPFRLELPVGCSPESRQIPFAHIAVSRCTLRSSAWAQSARILIRACISMPHKLWVYSQYLTW